MKFVLVTTAFRPEKWSVEEYYLRDIDNFLHTTKLSDAKVWDTRDELVDLLQSDHTIHAKIVEVKNKELFEAKLKNT